MAKTKTRKTSKDIIIVGGSGGMGRLLGRIWKKSGHSVTAMGRRNWDERAPLLKTAHLVVVCVPIQATEATIKRVAPLLGKNTILSDFTSIKEQPLKAMLKAHTGPVLGLHPVFGPSVKNITQQVIVSCPGRHDRRCAWVRTSLSNQGLTVKTMSAREHDDFMTIIQAVKHFSTVCLGNFLRSQKVDLDETMALSSPIYRLELDILGRIFSQDAELYADIIMADKRRIKQLEKFVNNMSNLLDIVKSGDRESFIKLFERTTDWMGPFAEAAMKESDAIINRMK